GRRFAGAGVLLLVLCGAMGLVAWFGYGMVEARLATLWKGDPLEEERMQVWSRVLPLAAEFPVWGTGFGTFEHVEPLTRVLPDNPAVAYDHAHNEYLETLVEGGGVGLALALAAVAFVSRYGYRAVRRSPPATAALALGALFAFTTLVLHSAGDFGLRLPAIVLLATVLCAQLAGLADADGADGAGQAAPDG